MFVVLTFKTKLGKIHVNKEIKIVLLQTFK